MPEQQVLQPLRIAVVGHTNTGKTSLMRTLMRDVAFGDVSDRPAVTRHVEGAALSADGRPVVELYDTPGLEDSIGLLARLDGLPRDGRDEVEVIEGFLAGDVAPHGQEAKALRQVLACDVALYVIDARERVLGRHRDELTILARCARPVVPVLNFTASEAANSGEWREALSRLALHAVAEFDTVVLDEESERRLFEKIRTLADKHSEMIEALLNDRAQARVRLLRASARLIAEMLVDCSAALVTAPIDNEQERQRIMADFRETIRERERDCVADLLSLHSFRADDYAESGLPIDGEAWRLDLFDPETLKKLGKRTGSAAAAGAAVGLVVDAAVGGLSLGAGAAIGAGLGALLEAGRLHGRRLAERLQGKAAVRCDDAALAALAARQAGLLRTLCARGHASFEPIRLDDVKVDRSGREGRVTDRIFKKARVNEAWSRLNEDRFSPDSGREQAIATLADEVEHAVRGARSSAILPGH